MYLRPIAEHLCNQGHRVDAVLRNLSVAQAIFGDLDIKLLQAPFKIGRPEYPIVYRGPVPVIVAVAAWGSLPAKSGHIPVAFHLGQGNNTVSAALARKGSVRNWGRFLNSGHGGRQDYVGRA